MSVDTIYCVVGKDVLLVNGVVVDTIPTEITPANPLSFADIFKFTQATNKSFMGVSVAQGTEDSVDMNNLCSNITLQGDFGLNNGGQQAFTIKGGAKDIFISGVIHNRGSISDVVVGGWADQTYDLSNNIDLTNLRHADGKKVRVIIGRATNVKLGTNCVEDKFGSFTLKVYWWFKWSVRKILKIKVGVSGPSWL